jgi:hypothetical protein
MVATIPVAGQIAHCRQRGAPIRASEAAGINYNLV